MKRYELILFALLAFIASFLFFGLLDACLITIAAVVSWLLLSRKNKNTEAEAIAFLAVVITLWLWVIKDVILSIFFHEDNLSSIFVMAFFALLFSILFIVALIKSKKPKSQEIAPISKFETDPAYLKKLNTFNTLIHILALGLAAYSFFVIPYDLLNDASVFLIIPQSILTLAIAVSLFWGALYAENKQSRERLIKISKSALWLNVFRGRMHAANLINDLNNDADKTFVRRWSVQGFYILLILLLPFYTACLHLPECYGVEMNSIWESFVYCVTKIPYVQLNIILLLLIYIVSYVPLTLANFIREKTVISVEDYKTVSLKQFFKRNIIISGIFIIVGVVMSLSILFGGISGNNYLTAQIEKHISRINNTYIKIYNETALSEFAREDYDNMNKIIIEHLGEQSVYKAVAIKDAQTDESGEKYISATFAGYNDNDDKVFCFLFRKYLTESNYHKIGEIELYLFWASETLTKQDVSKNGH